MSLRTIAKRTLIAASIALVANHSAQAANETWGLGSTAADPLLKNDFSLATNWQDDALPTGAFAYIGDAGDHNPVLNSNFSASLLTTTSGTTTPSSPSTPTLTGPFTLTGTGTLTLTGANSAGVLGSASNANFTVNVNTEFTNRSNYIVSGDYTNNVIADGGAGNFTFGSPGGTSTLKWKYTGTSANTQTIYAADSGANTGGVGTTITIYSKLDHTGETGVAGSGSVSAQISLRPDSLSTINLAGGIIGRSYTNGTNRSRSADASKLVLVDVLDAGQVGGKVILGDSAGWEGLMRIGTADLEINSSNSLGTAGTSLAGADYTEIMGAASTGTLRLTGGITTAEQIYAYARTSTAVPHLRNISGSNTISTKIIDDTTAANGSLIINSDGTGGGDLLTISGGLRRAGNKSNDLYLQGAGNGLVSGAIDTAGTGAWSSVNKNDGGTWTLSGNNTYTGNITVNGGTLALTGTNTTSGSTIVNGGTLSLSGSGSILTPGITVINGGTLSLAGTSSIPNSPSIDVKSGASFNTTGMGGGYTIPSGQTLKGNGTVTGQINLGGSGTRIINPGDVGAVGSLTTGNLNLTGAGTLVYDLTSTPTNLGGVNDHLTVSGNLTLAGTTTISVAAPGGLSAGTYNLMNYTGSLTGNQSNFSLAGVGGGGVRRTFDISTATLGQVNLLVAGPGTASSTLTWVGGNSSNTWNTVGVVNWSGGSGSDNRFFSGDSVVFDNTGSNSPPINVVGTVSPVDITTSNGVGHDYTFSSATGNIGATGNFNSTSAGNVTISVHDFVVAGSFTHNGTGTLTLSNSGLIGIGGAVNVNNGTLALNLSNPITVPNNISGNGTLRKDSTNTVTLSGDNIGFNGQIVINTGTVKVGNSFGLGLGSSVNIGNSGTLDLNGFSVSNASTTILGTGSIVVTSPGNLLLDLNTTNTVVNNISGTGGVTATTNNGTVTLTGANTYSGGTTILGGTVKLGVDNALGSGPLTFGNQTIATGALDMSTFNQTVSALSVISNSATPNTITIGAGKTLTVNGAFSVGTPSADNQTINLTVSGAGTLAVNNTTADVNLGFWDNNQNDSGSFATVDLTAVGSFTANVNAFNISNEFPTNVGTTTGSTVLFSNANNTITANSFTINDTNTRNREPCLLTLGSGTNTISTDLLVVGQGKGVSTINFASQAPASPGSLVLGGKATANVNIVLGNNSANTSGVAIGILEFRGHNVTVNADAIQMGRSSITGVGGGYGEISIDTGTFNVNSLDMAPKGSTGSGLAEAVINVGGGQFTVRSGGSVTMGSRSGSAGSSSATINVTGGTFTSNTNILQGAGTNVTSTINLDGGTLDLAGNTIGDATPITNLNLKSGTLSNVGQINNGASGLVKTTAGTLILAGSNAYTGDTTVSEGTLNITGNHTTGANYSIAIGANLNTKNVRVTNSLTVDGTATINANGLAAGASKVETLVIGAGGKLNLKDNDLVVGTAPNFDAVRTAIIAGKTNNAASGITSDITGFGISRGFGYAMGNDPKVSSLLAGSLAGQTYDADSVLVKYTLLGDADLDGDTDLNDLGLWSNGYTGDLGVTTSPTTFWTGGDFDYDGDTDLNDLGLWSSTYTGDFNGGPGSLVVNAPNASPEAVAILNSMGFTVVPEPSTFVLAGVGLAGLAIASRRRKK